MRMTSSLGADISQKYDCLGNVSYIEALNGLERQSWNAEIRRNVLGLEIEKGVAGGVTVSRSYDDFGRPVTMSVRHGMVSREQETYKPALCVECE